jgi:hypothetical protein
VARPVSLSIPAIDVHTRLIRLGLTGQDTLQVPASTSVAGWYTSSPRPGQTGSAIIAGHIDSYRGPGVFFRLRLLRPGDRLLPEQRRCLRRPDPLTSTASQAGDDTDPRGGYAAYRVGRA